MKSNPRPSALFVGFAALLIFSLGALPSLATNWVEVVKGTDGTHFYDADSVRIDGNLRYFWDKVILAKPTYETSAKGYVADKLVYWVVNCSNRTCALIQFHHRDVNGNILYSSSGSNENPQFVAPPPGSMGAILLNTVCSAGTRREQAVRIEEGRDASPPLADNWVELGPSPKGVLTTYYDADSVRIDKNLRYAWTKIRYTTPEDWHGLPVSIAFFYVVFDCSSRTAATIQNILLDVYGKTLSSGRPDFKFEPVDLGGDFEKLLNTFCSLEEGRDGLPPPAANWFQYARNETGTFYYHPESVRFEKNRRYAWSKKVYEKPTYDDFAKGYASSVMVYGVVDCSSRAQGIIRMIARDVNEKDLHSEVFQNPKLEVPVPGFDHFVKTVCSLANPSEEAPPTEGGREGTEGTSTVGSGFVVSSAGMVLTNAHVVSGCDVIRVTTAGGERRTASLAAADPQSDLALVRSSGYVPLVARFRVGRPVRLAEEIVALGYPLHGLLASGVNVSTGTVSALAGIANDSTKLQISAPVQPGNSGGPVLDMSGAVVGIVVAKLDAIKMAKAIGDIPQNVNFAIKADVARIFLEAQGVSLQFAQAGPPRKKEDVAATGREFTVLVECLKGQDAK